MWLLYPRPFNNCPQSSHWPLRPSMVVSPPLISGYVCYFFRGLLAESQTQPHLHSFALSIPSVWNAIPLENHAFFNALFRCYLFNQVCSDHPFITYKLSLLPLLSVPPPIFQYSLSSCMLGGGLSVRRMHDAFKSSCYFLIQMWKVSGSSYQKTPLLSMVVTFDHNFP